MPNWIYFALVGQGIWAFTSIVDKIVISKGYIKNPFVYIVLNGLMNVFLVFLLPFFNFGPLKFTDILIALFAGVMLSAAVTVYYKSVQYDEISRIKIMYQMEPILVLVLAFIFLGNVLTKKHFTGFLFLVAAGMIVSYNRTKKSFKLSKSFYLVLISILFAAFGYIAAKHILSVTSFWSAFLWLRLANSSALCVLLVPSIRNEFFETFKNMKNSIRSLLGFKMVIDFSAFIFANYALVNGPVALVAAMETSVSPLFVFIMTLLTSVYFPRILKEGMNKKTIFIKLSAILFIIIGIAFINL